MERITAKEFEAEFGLKPSVLHRLARLKRVKPGKQKFQNGRDVPTYLREDVVRELSDDEVAHWPTSKEAAQLLGINHNTLNKWVEECPWLPDRRGITWRWSRRTVRGLRKPFRRFDPDDLDKIRKRKPGDRLDPKLATLDEYGLTLDQANSYGLKPSGRAPMMRGNSRPVTNVYPRRRLKTLRAKLDAEIGSPMWSLRKLRAECAGNGIVVSIEQLRRYCASEGIPGAELQKTDVGEQVRDAYRVPTNAVEVVRTLVQPTAPPGWVAIADAMPRLPVSRRSASMWFSGRFESPIGRLDERHARKFRVFRAGAITECWHVREETLEALEGEFKRRDFRRRYEKRRKAWGLPKGESPPPGWTAVGDAVERFPVFNRSVLTYWLAGKHASPIGRLDGREAQRYRVRRGRRPKFAKPTWHVRDETLEALAEALGVVADWSLPRSPREWRDTPAFAIHGETCSRQKFTNDRSAARAAGAEHPDSTKRRVRFKLSWLRSIGWEDAS